MATQIFGSDHSVLLSREAENSNTREVEPQGGAVRGLFYAMLFNVMLAGTAVAAWGVWHLLMR